MFFLFRLKHYVLLETASVINMGGINSRNNLMQYTAADKLK